MTNNEKIMREALEECREYLRDELPMTGDYLGNKAFFKRVVDALESAPTLPPESAKELRAEANRVYAEVRTCIECNEAHGFTDHENAIGEILCSYKRILEKSESAWQDVRRAALEEAIASTIIRSEYFRQEYEGDEKYCAGVNDALYAKTKAIRALIDTPPKGEGAK